MILVNRNGRHLLVGPKQRLPLPQEAERRYAAASSKAAEERSKAVGQLEDQLTTAQGAAQEAERKRKVLEEQYGLAVGQAKAEAER